MNKQKLRHYYLEKDYNCAETVLRVANEEYDLGLNEDSFRLVSGFGGGMGCGETCGALSSAMAVISMFLVEDRAHATEGFKEKCAEFCQSFERELGSTKCSVLKDKYTEEGSRCLKTVELSYSLLENFLVAEGLIEAENKGVTVSHEDITRVKALGFLHNKGTDCFNGRIVTRNGKITAAENARIAEAAEKYGDGHIAMTTRLTLEVTGIPYENIEPFRECLAEVGLETGGTGSKVRPVVSCKGTTCQYGLCDTFALSDKIHKRFYKGYRGVKLPHKFKIAVGGCPNNCVKPSLNDFGIVGQNVPAADPELCRGCNKCTVVDACPVGAAVLNDGGIAVLEDQCNNCGRCIGKCPFGAMTSSFEGYKAIIGGRWGKKIAKGRPVRTVFKSEDEVLDVLEKAILLFREQGKTGERFSDTIERLGFDNVEAQLLDNGLLERKEEIINAQVHLKGGATC